MQKDEKSTEDPSKLQKLGRTRIKTGTRTRDISRLRRKL